VIADEKSTIYLKKSTLNSHELLERFGGYSQLKYKKAKGEKWRHRTLVINCDLHRVRKKEAISILGITLTNLNTVP